MLARALRLPPTSTLTPLTPLATATATATVTRAFSSSPSCAAKHDLPFRASNHFAGPASNIAPFLRDNKPSLNANPGSHYVVGRPDEHPLLDALLNVGFFDSDARALGREVEARRVVVEGQGFSRAERERQLAELEGWFLGEVTAAAKARGVVQGNWVVDCSAGEVDSVWERVAVATATPGGELLSSPCTAATVERVDPSPESPTQAPRFKVHVSVRNAWQEDQVRAVFETLVHRLGVVPAVLEPAAFVDAALAEPGRGQATGLALWSAGDFMSAAEVESALEAYEKGQARAWVGGWEALKLAKEKVLGA